MDTLSQHMKKRRMTITLTDVEFDNLIILAEFECRGLRDQASYMLGRMLEDLSNPASEDKVTNMHEFSKWISVKDALPNEEVDVLVCTLDGDIKIAELWASSLGLDGTSTWHEQQERVSVANVTHWMPLPHPAKL